MALHFVTEKKKINHFFISKTWFIIIFVIIC